MAGYFECLHCGFVAPVKANPPKCGQCGRGTGLIHSQDPKSNDTGTGKSPVYGSVSHPPRAVLFVDICSSTQLYETLGDAVAASMVGNCLTKLRERVEQAGGRVVQRIGDELLCLFGTADAALDGARVMQEWISLQEFGEPALAIRIGCHFGPVIENAGGLF